MQHKIFAITCLSVMLAISGIAITDHRLDQTSGSERTKQTATDQIASAAAQVLHNAMKQPSKRHIANVLVRESRCIAVVPSRLRLGIVVAGSYGDGVASCRIGEHQWSAPVFFALSTVSIGPQAGIESTALILLFMDQSIDILAKGKVELGADIEVTTGRLTAYKEVFIKPGSVVAYQQSSEGLFLGADIEGATIILNDEKNRQIYGYDFSINEILHGQYDRKDVPEQIKSYTQSLRELSLTSQNK